MTAAYLLLPALLFRSCLWAEDGKVPPPSFLADSIVNSLNGSPLSLTPNGLATINGSFLAESTFTVLDGGRTELPTSLGGMHITVGGLLVSLLYVSPGKVSFLIPSNLKPVNADLVLTKQNLSLGARIKLLDAAPALFSGEGRVAATHADGNLLSPASPARPGEVVVIYAAGLGRTVPPQQDGIIPRSSAQILLLDRLSVLLDGQPLPIESILYAGVTPGSPGVYQINLRLPDQIANDNPELRVALGDQISQSALVLHVVAGSP